ncbi:hypothetical protein ACIRBX_09130 [Kitasatospora sp. NPDC096147]|uniref:DUF6197 family protein n=1 Tax=Kitasatospora sp. NPDC096147 TaxID=3364093 RepID=UPI0038090695
MPVLAPPPLLTADSSALITEIEAYLAALPAPVRLAVPYVCPLGSVPVPWHRGFPLPAPTLLDRLLRRPPRPTGLGVADHLALTSRYLTGAGWVQGTMWDARGRVCLLGAQAAVLAHGLGTAAVARRARAQVMEVLHSDGHSVSSPDEYNDAPGTRLADVHRVLARAELRARTLDI